MIATGIVAAAQIAAAIGTLTLAALAYSQVKELRKTRIAQERPQVIVDVSYKGQLAYVDVRNIGQGAAKDIKFEFSSHLEKPNGKPLDKLPYLDKGMEYLAPGAEISTSWGSMIELGPLLEEQGLQDGITIKSLYKSLTGECHETSWTINPLLMIGKSSISETSTRDLVKVMEKIQKDFHKVIGATGKELKVSLTNKHTKLNEQNEEE